MQHRPIQTFIGFLVLVVAGCNSTKPIFRPVISVSPALKAAKAAAAAKPKTAATISIATVPPIITNSVQWLYPPGINPNTYCWTLQSSTDLLHWSDLPGACVTDPLTETTPLPCQFFRLKGVKP